MIVDHPLCDAKIIVKFEPVSKSELEKYLYGHNCIWFCLPFSQIPRMIRKVQRAGLKPENCQIFQSPDNVSEAVKTSLVMKEVYMLAETKKYRPLVVKI